MLSTVSYYPIPCVIKCWPESYLAYTSIGYITILKHAGSFCLVIYSIILKTLWRRFKAIYYNIYKWQIKREDLSKITMLSDCVSSFVLPIGLNFNDTIDYWLFTDSTKLICGLNGSWRSGLTDTTASSLCLVMSLMV